MPTEPESAPSSSTSDQPSSASPSLSLWQRTVAIFVRPGQAWGGLEDHVQWWFPVLILVVFSLGFTVVLYQRAIVPTNLEIFQMLADKGAIPEAQFEAMRAKQEDPRGIVGGVIRAVCVSPVMTLVFALLVWFALAFLLGRRLRYRMALELTAWSSLASVPGQLVAGVLAWFQGTMFVHTGFGALVPMDDPVTKLQLFLGTVLDALGPLALWPLIVTVIGASALTGVSRKAAALVLGSMYLAVVLFWAGVGALFWPA